MPETAADFDVAIIGGGLAGMTLALQLRREVPELAVVVLERNSLPPPVASHKVGESTVEIGAHYLAHTLGLTDLLDRHHLRKFGLRLFFGSGVHEDLADADELGPSITFPATSYQIDRGKFEGDLAQILDECGIAVLDNCVVKRASLSDNGGCHTIDIARDDTQDSIRCRWLVDAGSRAAMLKRQLGIGRTCEHKMVSAWFRLDKSIAVDDWSESDAWRQQCNRLRKFSTNHLMGAGYWVWIIPLAGDRTSIGVVADPDIHPLASYSNFGKLTNWLSLHQPRLASEVGDARDTLMDFAFRKNLSQDSAHVWSADRWALTGESGVFTDPFYSPGSDLIGISNTFVCDLIRRERSGSRFPLHVALYEQMYQSFFDTIMTLYERQYPGFGDARLMVVKTTWDYAYYWSILTWMYFREVMTDIDFLRVVQPRVQKVQALNEEMQAQFRRRASERRESNGRGRFFDQTAIPVLYNLNAALVEPTAGPEAEFNDNCDRLDSLAPMLLDLLAGKGGNGTCSLLGDLRQRFS